jgi:hypothetical protein
MHEVAWLLEVAPRIVRNMVRRVSFERSALVGYVALIWHR